MATTKKIVSRKVRIDGAWVDLFYTLPSAFYNLQESQDSGAISGIIGGVDGFNKLKEQCENGTVFKIEYEETGNTDICIVYSLGVLKMGNMEVIKLFGYGYGLWKGNKECYIRLDTTNNTFSVSHK